MATDPVCPRRPRQSIAKKPTPAMVAVMVAVVVAIAGIVYFAYQHLTTSPLPSTLDAAEAPNRDVSRSTQVAMAPADGLVQDAAVDAELTWSAGVAEVTADTETADPDMQELERELEQVRRVASVKPYGGAASVPLALQNSEAYSGGTDVPLALEQSEAYSGAMEVPLALEQSAAYSGATEVPLAMAATPGGFGGAAQSASGERQLVTVNPVRAVPVDTAGNLALRRWLENWEREAKQGRQVAMLSEDFRRVIESSSLSCPDLCALGGSVGFVEGDEVAAVFYRVALSRVERDLNSPGVPPRPIARDTLSSLYSISEVFMRKLKDYPTAERIYCLLRDHETEDGAARHRSAIRCAEAMRLQGRSRAADSAKALKVLLRESLSPDERREVSCAMAQSLFDAGNYTEVEAALPDWETQDPSSSHVEQGWVLLIQSAAKAGRITDARAKYRLWSQKAGGGRALPLDREVVNALSLRD